jgi:hypothetical protein
MLDASNATGTLQPAPVPEPSTFVILALAIGVWSVRRRFVGPRHTASMWI